MSNLEKNKYAETFSNIVDLPPMISNQAEMLLNNLPTITLNDIPPEVQDPFEYNYDYLGSITPNDFTEIPEDSEQAYPVTMLSGQRVTVNVSDIKAFTEVVNNLCKPDARYDKDFISFQDLTKQLNPSNLRILDSVTAQISPLTVSYAEAKDVLSSKDAQDVLDNTTDTIFLDVVDENDPDTYVGFNKVTLKAKPVISGLEVCLNGDNSDLLFDENHKPKISLNLDSILGEDADKFSGFYDLTLTGVKLQESTTINIDADSNRTDIPLFNDDYLGTSAVTLNIDTIPKLTFTVNANTRGQVINTANYLNFSELYTSNRLDSLEPIALTANTKPLGFESIQLDLDITPELPKELVEFAIRKLYKDYNEDASSVLTISPDTILSLVASYNDENPSGQINFPVSQNSVGFEKIAIPIVGLADSTFEKTITFDNLVNKISSNNESLDGASIKISPDASIEEEKGSLMTSVIIDDIDILSSTVSLESKLKDQTIKVISSEDPKIVTNLDITVAAIPNTTLDIPSSTITDFYNDSKSIDAGKLTFKNEDNKVFTSVMLNLPQPWRPTIAAENIYNEMIKTSSNLNIKANSSNVIFGDSTISANSNDRQLSEVTITLPECTQLELSKDTITNKIKSNIGSEIYKFANRVYSSVIIKYPTSTRCTINENDLLTSICDTTTKAIEKYPSSNALYTGVKVNIPKAKAFNIKYNELVNSIVNNTGGKTHKPDDYNCNLFSSVTVPAITSTNIIIDKKNFIDILDTVESANYCLASKNANSTSANKILDSDFINSVSIALPAIYNKTDETDAIPVDKFKIQNTILEVIPPTNYDYIKTLKIKLATTGQQGIDRTVVKSSNNSNVNFIKEQILNDTKTIKISKDFITNTDNKAIYTFDEITNSEEGIFNYLNSVDIALPSAGEKTLSNSALTLLLRKFSTRNISFSGLTGARIDTNGYRIDFGGKVRDFMSEVSLELPNLSKPSISIADLDATYKKIKIEPQFYTPTLRDKTTGSRINLDGVDTTSENYILDTVEIELPDFYNVELDAETLVSEIEHNPVRILDCASSSTNLKLAGTCNIKLPELCSAYIDRSEIVDLMRAKATELIADKTGVFVTNTTGISTPIHENRETSTKMFKEATVELPICSHLTVSNEDIKNCLLTGKYYLAEPDLNTVDFYSSVTIKCPELNKTTIYKNFLTNYINNNYTKVESNLNGWSVYDNTGTKIANRGLDYSDNKNDILSQTTFELPTATSKKLTKDLIKYAIINKKSVNIKPDTTTLYTSYNIGNSSDFINNVTIALPSAKDITLSQKTMATLLRNALYSTTNTQFNLNGTTTTLPGISTAISTINADFLTSCDFSLPNISRRLVDASTVSNYIMQGYTKIYCGLDGIAISNNSNSSKVSLTQDLSTSAIVGATTIELPKIYKAVSLVIEPFADTMKLTTAPTTSAAIYSNMIDTGSEFQLISKLDNTDRLLVTGQTDLQHPDAFVEVIPYAKGIIFSNIRIGVLPNLKAYSSVSSFLKLSPCDSFRIYFNRYTQYYIITCYRGNNVVNTYWLARSTYNPYNLYYDAFYIDIQR